jgi:hypothetical protein
VASLAGAGVLAACDLDPRSTPPPAAVPEPDPDERILLAARAELTGLIVRLRATLADPRQIDPYAVLVDLEQAHVTQLTALDGTPPTTSASASARPLRDGRRLVARELLAERRFTTWAERADNGDLARVLAATAAGIGTLLSGLADGGVR